MAKLKFPSLLCSHRYGPLAKQPSLSRGQARFLLTPERWVSLPSQPQNYSNKPATLSCGNLLKALHPLSFLQRASCHSPRGSFCSRGCNPCGPVRRDVFPPWGECM